MQYYEVPSFIYTNDQKELTGNYWMCIFLHQKNWLLPLPQLLPVDSFLSATVRFGLYFNSEFPYEKDKYKTGYENSVRSWIPRQLEINHTTKDCEVKKGRNLESRKRSEEYIY